MSRVFVVGAGPLQVPLIQAAKARGHWVLVADVDPAAVGIALADAFVQASTIDTAAVTRAALDASVEAVVTAATDQPLRAVAGAVAARGLAGISEETALFATRKDLMREAFRRHGVPSPASLAVGDVPSCEQAWGRLAGPVIVKPVDSSGSRGVTLVNDHSDLPRALAHALEFSRSKRAVLEEFVEGREFSVETLSVRGALHVLQVTEKQTTGPPHFVESGHTQPAPLTPAERRAIEDATHAAAAALGIETGPTHTELKLGPAGPSIIEVGARLGGDYITSDLVPLSTGIDMVGLTLELALGRDVEIPRGAGRASAIRYFYPSPGRVMAVEGVEECRDTPGVVRVEVFKGPGFDVVPVTGSHERAGYAIAAAATGPEAVAIAEACRERVRFRVV